MLTILLTSIVLTAAPGEPTEIIGTAATPDGGRDEITVEQPQNAPNPFGYVTPSPNRLRQIPFPLPLLLLFQIFRNQARIRLKFRWLASPHPSIRII